MIMKKEICGEIDSCQTGDRSTPCISFFDERMKIHIFAGMLSLPPASCLQSAPPKKKKERKQSKWLYAE